MARHRDSQQSKLYAAEAGFIALSPRFYDWAELLKFGDKVARSSVVKKIRPSLAKLGVTIKGAAGCNARYYDRRIHLNRDGWSVGMVLHEMAHLLVDPLEHPGHGREFRRVYYELVYHYGPKDSYKVLREGFRKHDLTYTAERPRRKLTAAAKQALTKQLLDGRKAVK